MIRKAVLVLFMALPCALSPLANAEAQRERVAYWFKCGPAFPKGFVRLLVLARLMSEENLDRLYDMGCEVDTNQNRQKAEKPKPSEKEEVYILDDNRTPPWYPASIDEILEGL